MNHSPNGPSSLFRRALCPGSYAAEIGMADLPVSDECDAGTDDHKETAEAILAGQNIEAFRFQISVYEDELSKFSVKPDVLVEQTLTFESIPEVGVGTPDCVLVSAYDKATIIDWKFTHINPDDADENLQLMAYAVEIAHRYEVLTVDVVLACVFDEKVTRFTYDGDKLLKAKERIQDIIAQTQYPFAARIPSPKACRYCRAVVPCLAGRVAEDPRKVDGKTISDFAVQAKLASIWIKAVNLELFSRLFAGDQIPGWKLEEGRANRSWKDEPTTTIKALCQLLDVQPGSVSTIEPKSPSQIEKEFPKSKKMIADMVLVKRGMKPVKSGEEDNE